MTQTDMDHPLAAARDRIQASAREIMKSFESAMNPPSSSSIPPPQSNSKLSATEGSLEQAFRLFFSSCTTGGTVAAENDEKSLAEDTAADLTPVSTLPSNDSSSSGSTPSPARQQHKTTPKKKPQALKNRSISAPPSRPVAVPLEKVPTVRTRSNNNDVFRESKVVSSSPPVAEHVYEQLFLDEQQQRSKRAGSPEQRIGSPPFPRIQPPRSSSAFTPIHYSNDDAIVIQHLNNDKDDEISAISAHTLEAMARDPHGYQHHLERHLSTLSTGTPSTGASSMMSFEQWQQAEKSYWAQQVVRNERRRRRRQQRELNKFDLSETAEI